MRSKKKYIIIGLLSVVSILMLLSGIRAFQESNVMDLVDEISRRLESYPEMSHWQATVLSTRDEMDKNWKSKKTTVVNKIVLMKDEKRIESIKSAVEIKKG